MLEPMSAANLGTMTPALKSALSKLALDKIDGYEPELVRDGRQCWLGFKRVPGRIIEEGLRYCAITLTSNDGAERYAISDIGRAILRRPELAQEVLTALVDRSSSFTVKGDRIVRLDPAPQSRNLQTGAPPCPCPGN